MEIANVTGYPIILAVSGKAFSGKDTFCKLAWELEKELEFQYKSPVRICRFAFADEVKRMATMLGWDGKKDAKGRDGLIWVGNGAREMFNPNIWIEKVIDNMEETSAFSGINIFIVTDCRYPNELNSLAEYATANHFASIRIVGKNTGGKMTKEQLESPSETALDLEPHDFEFVNDHKDGKLPYKCFVKAVLQDVIEFARDHTVLGKKQSPKVLAKPPVKPSKVELQDAPFYTKSPEIDRNYILEGGFLHKKCTIAGVTRLVVKGKVSGKKAKAVGFIKAPTEEFQLNQDASIFGISNLNGPPSFFIELPGVNKAFQFLPQEFTGQCFELSVKTK